MEQNNALNKFLFRFDLSWIWQTAEITKI